MQRLMGPSAGPGQATVPGAQLSLLPAPLGLRGLLLGLCGEPAAAGEHGRVPGVQALLTGTWRVWAPSSLLGAGLLVREPREAESMSGQGLRWGCSWCPGTPVARCPCCRPLAGGSWGSEPAPPPEDASRLPTSGPAPHLVHSVASLVLSSHWGVPPPHSQVEMFKPHPSSHPLDPTPALCLANGAHMSRDAGWRQARPAKNVAGGLPGGGVALKRAASVSPTPADAGGAPTGVGGSTVAARCWEVALGHRSR